MTDPQIQQLQQQLQVQQAQSTQILARLRLLEIDQSTEEDFTDPVLIYQNHDGSIVDPSSIEKIPDLIKEIPIFDGISSELSNWLRDVDQLIKAYQPSHLSSVEQKINSLLSAPQFEERFVEKLIVHW